MGSMPSLGAAGRSSRSLPVRPNQTALLAGFPPQSVGPCSRPSERTQPFPSFLCTLFPKLTLAIATEFLRGLDSGLLLQMTQLILKPMESR